MSTIICIFKKNCRITIEVKEIYKKDTVGFKSVLHLR